MGTRARRCLFGALSLPSLRRPYVASDTKIPLARSEAGASGSRRRASGVVQREWQSAGAVCQECPRSMLRDTRQTPLRASSPRGRGGVSLGFELRRERMAPFYGNAGQFRAWEVYFDDLSEEINLLASDAGAFEGAELGTSGVAEKLFSGGVCIGNPAESVSCRH